MENPSQQSLTWERMFIRFEDNGGLGKILFIGYKFEDNDFVIISLSMRTFLVRKINENIDWGLLEDIFPEFRVSSDGNTNLGSAEKNDADFFQHDLWSQYRNPKRGRPNLRRFKIPMES